MESDSSDDDNFHLFMSTFAAANAALANSELAITELLESSDDDGDESTSNWGGSRTGRSPNKKRNFELAFNNVRRYYFNGVKSLYDKSDFERRFGCPRLVFNRIHNAIMGCGTFVCKYNNVYGWGIYPLVRMVACFCKLVYGDASDQEDESLQISESQVNTAFKDFCSLIVQKFGMEYLNRSPTDEEKQRCLDKMSRRGFPGYFASWDCKHFQWANCPMKLAGQHLGKFHVLPFV